MHRPHFLVKVDRQATDDNRVPFTVATIRMQSTVADTDCINADDHNVCGRVKLV